MSERTKPKNVGHDAAQTPKPPPATSQRSSRPHEQEPTIRKGYEAAQDPEPQGDGDPGTDPVREQS